MPPYNRLHPHQLGVRNSFTEIPSLHNCPTPIAQLVDPLIHFLGIGPGLCTRDNLFGLGYLVLLAINFGLIVYAIYMVLAIFARLCSRCGGTGKMRMP